MTDSFIRGHDLVRVFKALLIAFSKHDSSSLLPAMGIFDAGRLIT